jgi:acetolactate synthase-1/2/3 large subunit
VDTFAVADPSRPTRISAGDAIVAILVAAGVRRMYSVPGESYLEVIDAADRSNDMTLISTRHESGAAFMAEADAKLTGLPAVAAATRGVGAANLAIGVHTAMQDSTPMIVLLGQVDTTYLGREAFQEIDLPAFYQPITKFATTIHDVKRLPDTLARAITHATSGRPGPVMLALPADVLRGTVPAADVADAIRAVSVERAAPVPIDAVIQSIADQVAKASAPVIIAGGGARNARAQLVEFADAYGVGVYAAFRRQDVFPNDHPNYLGHLTIGTPASCLRALEDADLVVVLGARLDEITTQSFRLPARGAQVIHIDVDPSIPSAAMGADRAVVADPGPLLRALAGRAQVTDIRDWSAGHIAYLKASTPNRRATSDGVDPAAVLACMSEVLPADTIITNDAGNFSAFVHSYWRFNEPFSQLAPISGAMGYGVPAGVAAAIASNGRTVVATAGDGGFLMSGQEIETAVRYGLDLIVVVFRNGLYGTIAMHQQRLLGRTAGIDIGAVDIAGFARSLGARGISVDHENQLEPALIAALGGHGVTVLDVRVDPDLTTPTTTFSALRQRGT